MRKFLAAALALATVVLAACGGAGDRAAGTGQGQPAGQPASGSQPAGGQKKITVWHLIGHKDVVEDAIKRFKQANPGVEVEAVGIENDPYKTKLKVALGTEGGPDIFHSWGGGWLKAFVDAGLVEDLTPHLAAKGWKDSIPQSALAVATYDGKTYGIPLAMNAVFVWYRKDIFAQYGLQPPKTYDEFLNIVKTLKSKGVIPISLANKSKWPGAFYLIYFATRIGGEDLFTNAFNRKSGYSFADPAFVEAGRRIQELVDLGAFPPGFNGLNYDTGESRQLFYAGKAAMELQGGWYLNSILTEAKDILDKVDFFPFPAIPGGKGDPSSLVGGASPVFSVSSKAKHKAEALELLRYLTDKNAGQMYADKGLGIPTPKGVDIKDPYLKRIADSIAAAKYVQLYYDQYLPPELAEVHKDTTQALFGKSMTPEAAAKTMEEKAQQLLKK